MKKMTTCWAVVTAAAVLTLGSAFTALAAGWTIEDGEWAYEKNNGEYAKDAWQQDGEHTYYLGSDGYMVRSTLLNINENYYYVNSSGAMVTNEWRQIDNAAWQPQTPEDTNWYYFDNNGRALRSKDGQSTVHTIGDKKYIFDEYGRMLTGWITESAELSTEADAWQQAIYYSDAEEGGGAILTNAWLITSVHDEDNEDDNEPTYTFYFSAAGKKTVNDQKTIEGKKYYFGEHGEAKTGWIQEDGSEKWHFYGDEEDCSLRTGWFEAVPSEDMHAEHHSDGTSHWYYASSKGDLTVSQLKTISSKVYGFNEYGEMLTGLYKVKVSNKEISEYDEVEYDEDLPDENDEEWLVYYFNESNGEVRTGTQTVDLNSDNQTFYFRTSGANKGAGINGIDGNYIYKHGQRLKAESGTKYGIVTYKGERYLVNTSGVLAKKKTNVTDSDGMYYCTDEKGIVTYFESEKKPKN